MCSNQLSYWSIVSLCEEEETRTPTGWAHYPLKVARLPFRHLSIRVVPTTRIELARLSTLAPETSASTIPPRGHFLLLSKNLFSHKRAENETRTRDPNLQGCALPTELFPHSLWTFRTFPNAQTSTCLFVVSGSFPDCECKGSAFSRTCKTFQGKNT